MFGDDWICPDCVNFQDDECIAGCKVSINLTVDNICSKYCYSKRCVKCDNYIVEDMPYCMVNASFFGKKNGTCSSFKLKFSDN